MGQSPEESAGLNRNKFNTVLVRATGNLISRRKSAMAAAGKPSSASSIATAATSSNPTPAVKSFDFCPDSPLRITLSSDQIRYCSEALTFFKGKRINYYRQLSLEFQTLQVIQLLIYLFRISYFWIDELNNYTAVLLLFVWGNSLIGGILLLKRVMEQVIYPLNLCWIFVLYLWNECSWSKVKHYYIRK